MPELARPTIRVHASFIAAMAEFRADGRGDPDGDSTLDRELAEHGERWPDPGYFAEYVRRLRDEAREDAPRPDGIVPQTTLWWIDGAEYLGRIAIRHRLTPHLLHVGGHIGYDVRPSARRRGHATAMLAAALPFARSLGLGAVLLTCDVNNLASRKVIEAGGGMFDDERDGKLRFWIPEPCGETRPGCHRR